MVLHAVHLIQRNINGTAHRKIVLSTFCLNMWLQQFDDEPIILLSVILATVSYQVSMSQWMVTVKCTSKFKGIKSAFNQTYQSLPKLQRANVK